nr:DUF1289 domain-containing protein [Aureimonas mangrovi]
MESPCILVCHLDPASGICIGCGRSGEEIANWVAMGEKGRRAVMAALPARMADAFAKKPVGAR